MTCSKRAWCPPMQEQLAPNAQTKTPGLVETWLVRRFKSGRIGKEYKAGVVSYRDRKDAGMWLRFCPWCGKNICFLRGSGGDHG